MMVGHTHEDIDALFKLIVVLWRRQRHVLCPREFARLLQEAIPSSVVHPFLEYVHDWADFFSECIYDNVEGITTAREFILRKRDDGGVWRLRYVTNDALLLLQLPPPTDHHTHHHANVCACV